MPALTERVRLIERPISREFESRSSRRPQISVHISALDGVRGLAILLVLICHFTMGMSGQSLPAQLFFRLTSVGWCGVDLFFVLSGFLITGILYDTKTAPHRFRNFYMRRALRIFPLYYGSLLVVFGALHWTTASTRGFQGVEEAWPWLWSYGTNLLVASRGTWFPLSHFWSLAVEEHFYLIWPMIIFGFDRRASLRICGVVIVISLAVRIWLVSQGLVLAAYCLTVCRMDALAIGGFIALAARGERGIEAILPYARWCAQLSGGALLALAGWRFGLFLHDAAVQTVGYLLLDLFFASIVTLIVAAPSGTPLTRLFDLAILRCLGRYSYGLYVYNSIFLLVSDSLSLSLWLSTWSDSVIMTRTLYVAVAAVTTCSVTWLSWHLIEKQFLKLKRYFQYNVHAHPPELRGSQAVGR